MQLGQLAMADNPISVWLRNTIYRMTPKSEGDKQFAYLYKVGALHGGCGSFANAVCW